MLISSRLENLRREKLNVSTMSMRRYGRKMPVLNDIKIEDHASLSSRLLQI